MVSSNLVKSSGETSGGLTAYRLSSGRVPGLSLVVIFRPVLRERSQGREQLTSSSSRKLVDQLAVCLWGES